MAQYDNMGLGINGNFLGYQAHPRVDRHGGATMQKSKPLSAFFLTPHATPGHMDFSSFLKGKRTLHDGELFAEFLPLAKQYGFFSPGCPNAGRSSTWG